MSKKFFSTMGAAFFLFVSANALAADVDVPADELVQETVYPVFDNPVSVKNRNVKDFGTFDFGFFGGLALTEPISNTTKFGVNLNYHFNETHSLGILWAKNSSGLSKDAQGIKDDYGLDYGRAPYPEYTLMADYNFKAFYGKLSFTSNSVVNTSIYASVAGGTVKYIHKSYPALALGLGERFYMTNQLSLKIDLRFYAHQAPIPFKKNALKATDPVPQYSDFEERLTYTTNLEVGLNYLF